MPAVERMSVLPRLILQWVMCFCCLLCVAGRNEAFVLWSVGFRFGEADSPGPSGSSSVRRQWSDGSDAWSDAAEQMLTFYRANSSAFIMYSDSGASRLISSRRAECDNIRTSDVTWGGAAAEEKAVDAEADYRYFVWNAFGELGSGRGYG